MPERDVDFLIVGGGDAGFSCARTLREQGADGTVVVVSRDPDPPYDRTACSKGYLRGSQSRADTLLAAPDWWDRHDVELLARTSALKLDVAEKTVTLSNKDTVRYGKLLVATGANVRRLRLEGSDLQGIHYLRALGNADAIRRGAEDAERIVLVGGSYIATEVAATLTSLGKPCVLVMQEEVTLERGFGRRVGRFFQGLLEQHGVEVHPGQDVERFEGVDGRVTAVVTRSGRRIAGDVVVVGAGVMPDVMLARSPQAYAAAKRLLWLAANVDLESGMVAEGLAQSLLIGTSEHREGVAAARRRIAGEARTPDADG